MLNKCAWPERCREHLLWESWRPDVPGPQGVFRPTERIVTTAECDLCFTIRVQLLQGPNSATPCTAIIIDSPQIGVGALLCGSDPGKQVPRDLSTLQSGDRDLPPLLTRSTARAPRKRKGGQAVGSFPCWGGPRPVLTGLENQGQILTPGQHLRAGGVLPSLCWKVLATSGVPWLSVSPSGRIPGLSQDRATVPNGDGGKGRALLPHQPQVGRLLPLRFFSACCV